eukprot:Polyplicarium_translucidae@DN2050_c0_g1_i1.p2
MLRSKDSRVSTGSRGSETQWPVQIIRVSRPKPGGGRSLFYDAVVTVSRSILEVLIMVGILCAVLVCVVRVSLILLPPIMGGVKAESLMMFMLTPTLAVLTIILVSNFMNRDLFN